MKKYIYKGLALTNDIKALKKGRIVPRIWNRLLCIYLVSFFYVKRGKKLLD